MEVNIEILIYLIFSGRKPGGRNAGLSSGNNKRGNFVQPTKDTNKTPNAPLHVTSHWPPLLQMDKNQSGYKKRTP